MNYIEELGKIKTSRLNEIIVAFNKQQPKETLELSEVELVFYENLEREAQEHFDKYGFYPVFEVGEIEYDDEVLEIYG